MAINSDDKPKTTMTAVVSIRIPCRANEDLITDAEERLSRAEGVADVTVDKLQTIDPGVSATVVTIRATFRLPSTDSNIGLKNRLTDAPGLVTVERLG